MRISESGRLRLGVENFAIDKKQIGGLGEVSSGDVSSCLEELTDCGFLRRLSSLSTTFSGAEDAPVQPCDIDRSRRNAA